MADIIIGSIIILAVIFAVGYIIKEKRNGKKCIGCPYSENCGGSCGESKK
ncbi:MAG: FeoB-associated Cys-rich membrane protein [Clostridiales bacterium]|nr:FeoB-associated Cys-rich membrane protein [Clostridiales bacterium]